MISARRVATIFFGLALLEGLSWLAYQNVAWRWPMLLVLMAALLVASWRRPAIVVYAGFVELLVGGKGQLLFAQIQGQTFSLRYAIFTVLLIVALRHWPTIRQAWKLSDRAWWPPIILLVWVVIASIWGLIQGYPAARVFTDGNAFGFLLTAPLWGAILRAEKDWRSWWWPLLVAGLALIALKSWLLMVLFGQAPDWVTEVYRWVRNTGSGEITPINKTLYRVFLQSQLYAVIGGMALIGGWLTGRRWGWQMVGMVAATLSFLISLSRTFWLGAAAAGVVMLILLFWRRQWMVAVKWWPGLPISLVIGYGLFLWSVNFPALLPPSGGINSAVRARLTASGSAEAANARRNQIQPLLAEIQRNPVFGRGVGAQARYFNPDPRIKGWRETSAFELGYLDWWLKFGLVGLGLLGWWVWSVIRRAWHSPWAMVIIPSVVGLAAIHLTSPYLNHPLGIGWLAILSALAYERS